MYQNLFHKILHDYFHILFYYFIEFYQSPGIWCGAIKVYKNNKIVYENNHVISYEKDFGTISNIFDYERLPIEITNNKLFFFDDYSNSKKAYTSLKSINLDSNQLKEETYLKIPADLGTGNCYENEAWLD